MRYPSVTVAIPALNESENIEQVIKSFLQTKYPKLIEIFIADGGSNDGTQEIVKKFRDEDRRIKIIHNPLKLQSAGLNLILNHCQGEVFVRADAHSNYACDYIESCIEVLLETKALNVGGSQRFVATNAFQSGVALASRSFLGNGGAKYRVPNYNGCADTVFLGCFWTKTLRDLSGYSVESTPNEDAELNMRLIEKNPQAIYVSSKIKVWYYPRKTWQGLLFQYFKYGRSRCVTFSKHLGKGPLRSKVPVFFITATAALWLSDIFLLENRMYMNTIISILMGIPFLEGFRITCLFYSGFKSEIWRGEGANVPSFVSRWLYCGIALITMPLAYFVGYIYELVNRRLNLNNK